MRKIVLLWIICVPFFSCTKNVTKKKKILDNLFYDKAFEYRERGNTDSAAEYFYKAKDLFLQRKDNFGVGKCLVNLAIFQTEKADYFGGQETSVEALKYLNKNNKNHSQSLGSNYNNLGIISYKLKNYSNAIGFYDLAINLSTDSLDTRIYLNNKARSLQEIKNYKQALKIYDSILKETNDNQKEYARSLTNISFTKWLQDVNYNAAPDLLKALEIREKENDKWGQNSSYSHLSDYYSRSHPDSALSFAHKMYKVAKEIESPDDQLRALGKLIKLSPSTEIKNYFSTYQNLGDSLQTAQNATKNQFAFSKYESQKNKSDNLKLQKDNTENKYQIIKQKIALFTTLLLVITGSIIAFQWYKKRKQKLDMEAQNSIRVNQLKTSKKVHDVVANGLYRVMAEIENQDRLDREGILDKLEDMYEKSRDISYEQPEVSINSFPEKISALLMAFATERTKVIIAGNTSELWAKVNSTIQSEIEHILQELMVNMKKHSGANNVAIRFEYKNNKINIYYTDNGIGMSKETQFNNGLRNTGNRIECICGEIIFDTKQEKGLKIQISFPVS